VLGNHDRPRIASRVGVRQARVAAMLLLTLRGTPTLYYGDEIGMRDVPIPAQLQQDPARFHGASGGRDPERTPMRWDATPGAGFSSASPWLPVGEVGSINVSDQRADPRSMLQLHRQLLALRRAEPALALGDWAPLTVSGSVLAYERSVPGRRLVIVLELGGRHAELALGSVGEARVLLSTHLDRAGEFVRGVLTLRADEGVVLELLSSPRPSAETATGR
jgi:alpha-glucosidase